MPSVIIEPTEFDLIVLGTGLPESLIAGAAAAAGQKVLHLEFADAYGCHWASLSLDQVTQWAADGGSLTPPADTGGGCTGDDSTPAADRSSDGVEPVKESQSAPWLDEINDSDLELFPLAPESLYSDIAVHDYSERSILDKRYTLDLGGPRLAFTTEPLVEAIIRSGCHNYMEFKPTDGSFLWQHGGLTPVPSSRASIFQASMSLAEKRVVSRFFNKVTEYLEARNQSSSAPLYAAPSGRLPGGDLGLEDPDAPFVDLLKRHDLPQTIREMILYAICMVEREEEAAEEGRAAPVTTLEGLQALKMYLSSMGRFGGSASPFIYPLYGAGELPQSFCRVAAVQGAVYVLRHPVQALLVTKKDHKSVAGVLTQGKQVLRAPKVVLAPGLLPPPPRCPTLSRCICITQESLEEGMESVLLVLPPNAYSNPGAVKVLQMGVGAAVAPGGRFVVHMSTPNPAGAPAEALLRPSVQALFTLAQTQPGCDREGTGVTRPQVLWCVFYNQSIPPPSLGEEECVGGVWVCPMPDASLDYRTVTQWAESAFRDILPGAVFFPFRASGNGDGGEEEEEEDRRDASSGG